MVVPIQQTGLFSGTWMILLLFLTMIVLILVLAFIKFPSKNSGTRDDE